MSKRRLNDRQSRRIVAKRRPEDNTTGGVVEEGLVLARYAAQADVEPLGGGTVIRCPLRANLGDLAAGDRVQYERFDDGGAVVTGVLPRVSEFRRPDKFGNIRLVAANITRACITLAKTPEPQRGLLDRYLVVAEHFDFEVLLIVNKCDALAEADSTFAFLQDYAALGYPYLFVSAKTETGFGPLSEILAEGVSLFAGQSGVGKSSILQSLLPNEALRIGDLSEAETKGRHTTTQARLYHFPGGGACIDSPGIREFGLWHLESADIAAGFREFQPLLGSCRFRDCRHLNEPGCAILAALAAGDIRRARYASYAAMLSESGRE